MQRVSTTIRFPRRAATLTAVTLLAATGSLVSGNAASADPGQSWIVDGQWLSPGQYIQSDNGKYRTIMQTDGNLVTYTTIDSVAVWQSGTYGNPGSALAMQKDGNLVIYAPGNRAIWNTRTVGHPHSLVRIQADGNLVVVAAGNISVWDSKSTRKAARPNPSPQPPIPAPPTPVRPGPQPTPPPVTPAVPGNAPVNPFAIVVNCGTVTCSAYLSRHLTKKLGNLVKPLKGGKISAISAAAGVACAGAGPAGWVCSAAAAAAGFAGDAFVNTAVTASSRNECMRIRTTRAGTIVGLYNDNSKFCRN